MTPSLPFLPHPRYRITSVPTQTTAHNLPMVFCTHLGHLDPTSPTHTDITREQLLKASASCQETQLLEHHIIQNGRLRKNKFLNRSNRSGIFVKSCVSSGPFLKSTRSIVTTSIRPSMLDKIEELNITFVSLEMLSSGQTWPKA